MPARAWQLAVMAAVVLSCLALRTAAAALALRRPTIERFDTDTRSQLNADYSADSRGVRFAPLDVGIIDVAVVDERALGDPAAHPRRVEVAHVPTRASPPGAEPDELTATPRVTPTRATPTPTPDAATPSAGITGPAPMPTATQVAPLPTDTPSPVPPTFTSTPRPPRPTVTPTNTRLPTRTATRTATSTVAATPTRTPSLARTATSTATGTATYTVTPTPTLTATGTATITPTATDTSTVTPVPTATSTGTPIATSTPTSTLGPTLTPTAKPSDTATATATAVATASPTLSPSPTSTPAATATPADTATPLPTATDAPTPTPRPVAIVYVSPASQTVPGPSVHVDVAITGVDDLGGYAFTLSWDPAILSFVSVTSAAFLGSTGRTVACAAPTVTATSITFSCGTTGASLGPNDGGILASIKLTTVAEGVSPMTLSDLALGRTSGATHDVKTKDGEVTVAFPTPTPTVTSTPTVTPSPTPTPAAVSVSLPTQTDASVWMSNPDSNFGSDPNMHVDGDATQLKRSFLSFDLTAIPAGSTINQAVLSLCFAVNPGATAQGRIHDLLRVQSAWSELTLTWNNQPPVGGLQGPPVSITVPATAQCVTVTVTDAVQAWEDGGSNFGWRVSDQDETGSNSDTVYGTRESPSAAERPRLDVTYTPP